MAVDAVLLMRAGQSERTWWFTIGGGIADGEDSRTAAVRETFEETGLRMPSCMPPTRSCTHPTWESGSPPCCGTDGTAASP
jgi:8-oxo-dGTP pyrophosphatase MutT (NUDIX family)